MEYVFPYENMFVGGVVMLIVVLLIVRVKVVRQRRKGTREVDPAGVISEQIKGRPPQV